MSLSKNAMTVVRVTSGNFLEMFDFFLFGFFAPAIGEAFFPRSSDFAKLMLVFATFGAGFLMRPLGALLLGAYVDRVGRRMGLVVTLSIMASGTLLIALTPSMTTLQEIAPPIAFLAPLLVLVGRLAQGFSAGVELGGVSVYLAEMAPARRKGLYASWQSASQQLAIMVAAVLGFTLSTFLTSDQILRFGWRIPFLIGCSIIPLIFVLRRSLVETSDFLARTHHPTLETVVSTLRANWRLVGLGSMLVMMTTVSFYLITVYTPTFGSEVLKLSSRASLAVAFCVGVSNFIWLPVMGALSDRIGRRPLLITFTALALLTSYPTLVWLVAGPSFIKMLIALLWLSFLYASYNGALIVALTEIMPAEVRTSGFSLAYSIATALFGGFTPAVSTWLIRVTSDKAAPGLWMTAAAATSLVATLTLFSGTSRHGLSSKPARDAD